MKSVVEIESENRRKYSGEAYDARTICRPLSERPPDYASRMLALKLSLVMEQCPGPVLVDLCCGAGEHLRATARDRSLAIGVDFSVPFLMHAAEHFSSSALNVRLVAANARVIPLASESVDALYSLSSLYYMPRLREIIGEIARVLRPGGRCVLDLGARSLNTVVCASYPELAVSCHVSVDEMTAACAEHGLRVVSHRRFQILPMWGDRPRWLMPLLSPVWPRVLSLRVGGRMLDEWVSSVPGLRRFAFRNVLLCEKS